MVVEALVRARRKTEDEDDSSGGDERRATGDGAMGISGRTERCSDLICEVSLLLSAVVQRR